MSAIMQKPNASLVKAMQKVGESDEYIGMVTLGSSGAILIGSYKFLATENMTRPCLGALLPNADGNYTLLVDAGATIDATAYQLNEFATLGSEFMRKLYNIPSPQVAILSNGAEAGKGNKLVKETYPLLLENQKKFHSLQKPQESGNNYHPLYNQ